LAIINYDTKGQISACPFVIDTAGFKHILDGKFYSPNGNQFASLGIESESQLSKLIFDTVSTGNPVGTYGGSGTVYAIGGGKYLNIVISDNGFIVTAHPITALDEIARIIFN
jgi:hypothetical protein